MKTFFSICTSLDSFSYIIFKVMISILIPPTNILEYHVQEIVKKFRSLMEKNVMNHIKSFMSNCLLGTHNKQSKKERS